MKFKENEKGITLIALAVTIIVILILAGVTIATLTSENGIVNQATSAKEKNNLAKIEEEIKLEYSNLILKKQLEGKLEETKLDELVEKLREKGYSIVENDNKYYINTNEKYYEVKLDSEQLSIAKDGINNLEDSVGIKASDIAQSNNKKDFYGKKVTGYTCPNTSGVETWRIFYSDNDNIYLIADDYVTIENVPTKNGKALNPSVDENGNVYPKQLNFNSEIIDQYTSINASLINNNVNSSLNSSIIDKWMNRYKVANFLDLYHIGAKATAYMLDTEIWNNLYKGEKAKYAIGSPTLEMFKNSWEDTHETELECDVLENSGGCGYKVKWKNNGQFTTYLGGFSINEFNDIYVKPLNSNNNLSGMWFTAPAGGLSMDLLTMYQNGVICNSNYKKDGFGFRPIVCLKNEVKLNPVGSDFEIIK